MSEITDRIKQYRRGNIKFSTLLGELAHWSYQAPERYQRRSRDPFAVEITDPPVFDKGTWDEVREARNLGLLTPDEYLEIAKRAWSVTERRATGRGTALGKAQLQQQVAELAGLNKAQAGRAVDAVLDAITSALKNGEEFRLTGFGTFRVANTAARKGRNPRTGDAITIPAGKRPAFTAGSRLEQAISGG